MRFKICASLTTSSVEDAITVEPLVDLYEVRIDLIGGRWATLAGKLRKPWLACNRSAAEGGKWQGSEEERIGKLREAVEIGASIVDIELNTPAIERVLVGLKHKAECLISYHNFQETPEAGGLEQVIEREIAAGADICKLATTARRFEDNYRILQLFSRFPNERMVCFAMGEPGKLSRVISPLAGADFTYASVSTDSEAAPGQLPALELRNIYDLVGKCQR